MKRNKGITLIALVITIIILIILAGITMNAVFGENGLIKKVQDAKIETRGGAVQEARDLWIMELEADKYSNPKTAKLLEELLDELEAQNMLIDDERETIEKTGQVTIGSRTIVFGAGQEIEIGAYVNYQVLLTAEEYLVDENNSGYSGGAQIFTTETTAKWRVLEVKNDGRIVLISEIPVNADNGIDGTGLYLKGAIGYNNAEDILNEMCDTLYSVSGKGTAFSMTFEDTARVTGYNKVEITDKYIENGGHLNRYPGTYTFPSIYVPEIDDGTTLTEFISPNNWDYFDMDILASYDLIENLSSPIYDLIFGGVLFDSEEMVYWLASRGICVQDRNIWCHMGCCCGWIWICIKWRNGVIHFGRKWRYFFVLCASDCCLRSWC